MALSDEDDPGEESGGGDKEEEKACGPKKTCRAVLNTHSGEANENGEEEADDADTRDGVEKGPEGEDGVRGGGGSGGAKACRWEGGVLGISCLPLDSSSFPSSPFHSPAFSRSSSSFAPETITAVNVEERRDGEEEPGTEGGTSPIQGR